MSGERVNPARVRTAGFFVARTPLLSANAFRPSSPDATFDVRVAELRAFIENGPAGRALAAASPSLATALAAPSRTHDDVARVGAAVMRYVERMRGRATPFGLCAGYTIGAVGGAAEHVQLDAQESYRCVYRLDVDAVHAAVTNAVAKLGDDARYISSADVVVFPDVFKATRRGSSGDVTYVDVRRTAALDDVLAYASAGRSAGELVALARSFAASDDEARACVNALIEHGLIVAEAAPPVSTDDELAALERVDELRPVARAAREIRFTSLGDDIGARARALDETLTHGGASKLEPVGIYDLVKPLAVGGLGDEVVREALRLVPVLERLRITNPDRRFEALRQHLLDRYEGREVPLVEALDPSRGFLFPETADYAKADAPPYARELYEKSVFERLREVSLTDGDLPPERAASPWRGAGAMMFRASRGREGPVLFGPRLLGQPGTNAFARATAFIPELRERTRAFLRAQAEACLDEDMADLVYFVLGKSAALIQFPSLQPFEVTLASTPGVPAGQRVDLNELLVSVRGGRVVLRSRRTGRRIRVRAVGAANVDRPDVTSLARFLSVMDRQDDAGGGFAWGSLAIAPFLPRVLHGRHVLAPAMWNLGPQLTRSLREAKTPEDAFRAAKELRAALDLPRHVVYREQYDHILPIDLDDVLSVYAWRDIARERMILAEAFSVDESIVEGPEGRFHHEIVLPLLEVPRRAGTRPSDTRLREPRPFDERATFDRRIPGGDVLFLKIYGDREELLPVVTDVLRDGIVDARDEGRITHWFFLPYADPNPHVRLRLFGAPADLYGPVLAELRAALAPLVAARAVREVVVATYERETVRYGGPVGLELAERLFWASSEAAVLFHDEEPLKQYDEKRVLTKLVHAHRAILLAAGFDLEGARRQAAHTAASYQRAADPMISRRRSGELFRELRAELAAAPDPAALFGDEIAARFQAAFAELRRCESELSVTLSALIADVMHVHSLRCLTVWPETPDLEEIIYFTLEKALVAEISRASRGAL